MTMNDSAPPPKMVVTVPEAGEMLGIGRNAAYAAAQRGDIPVIKIGKLKRVPVRAIEAMLDRASRE
jgi:excisionase family DNA binding protein